MVRAPGGRELTAALVRAGAWVLDPALVTGEPHRLDAEVTLACRVAAVPRAAVEASPELARTLTGQLAHQQVQLLRLLERSLFWDLGARLGAYLLEHDRPAGQALPTNSALAALLGTVPELVSRKLGEFYRQGWIRLERRRLWVVRPEALRRLQPDE